MKFHYATTTLLSLTATIIIPGSSSFIHLSPTVQSKDGISKLFAGMGFGKAAASSGPKPLKKKKKKQKKQSTNMPYIKSQSEDMIREATEAAQNSPLGKAVEYNPSGDEFWELIPILINSKFSHVKNLDRIAGFLKYATNPCIENLLGEDIIEDKWRPHNDLHAFMPGLGPRQPFLDPSQLELCKLLEENYDIISQEYEALVQDMTKKNKDRFQSVTSMNYEAGWKTVVLFYNGHRIPDFPYHICPVTTKILETVPIGGRIAGFNRQKPNTGISVHSDGNNMWLTCQMGLNVPQGKKASIRVGDETRHWETGKCLLYDTTYEHETFNASEDEERVVLHVDFFNTLAMTKDEIEILQYIYEMREKFLKAEGVSKVGSQIL